MKKTIVGIDISKETLDLVIVHEGVRICHDQIENRSNSLKGWFRSQKKILPSLDEVLICMENTGVYGFQVLKVVGELSLSLWLADAGSIKAFHSLSRGKDDATDAERIAQYAYLKQSEAKLWSAPREVIEQLHSLLQLRKRLIVSRQRLESPVKEDLFMEVSYSQEQLVAPVLKTINGQVKKAEDEINGLIKNDERLKSLYDQLISVKGVGFVVAVSMIVLSNEFKTITDPKKMACHCGVAPFRYESGKSIKGRTKVSPRAHKSMKALLNMAARASVSCKGELHDYYHRKVAEGKNKMLVLNAVRNKLIHRMYAVVRENRKYENFYTPQLD